MKKAIFIVSAILLLAAGCGKSASVQSGTSATSQSANQPAATSQTSLKALMMAGVAQKCTVNYSNKNSQSQGTIYLASGKMRGDFTGTNAGKTETSHMINDGTTVYTWVDGMAMAMKMSVSAMQAMQSTSTAQSAQNQSVDPNANYQYNCSPWSVDSSLFAAPANINFTDESQMLMNMHSGAPASGASAGASANSSASIKAQECAACNNAGASKAQCLAAMHC
jgi:hypothetical protein